MEEILKDFCELLEAEMPELRWVDIEAGQLDALDDNYPVSYPAVWVDVQNIDWRNTGYGVDHGTVTVNFRVALDIYNDTHTGAPDREAALAQFGILTRMHSVVGLHGGKHYNRFVRVRTIGERRADGLKVFNVSYKCDVYDTAAAVKGVPVEIQAVEVVRSKDRKARQAGSASE